MGWEDVGECIFMGLYGIGMGFHPGIFAPVPAARGSIVPDIHAVLLRVREQGICPGRRLSHPAAVTV